MHERNCYAARPPNTSGTPLGEAYLEFLRTHFRLALIVTDFTQKMHAGAGLALPVQKVDGPSFMIPAEIAKELATIRHNGGPTWIVTCTKHNAQNALEYRFVFHEVISMAEVDVPSPEKEGKETLRTFVTSSGIFPTSFHQMTIQATRERIYYWPDRARTRPYFLEDCPVFQSLHA